MLDTHRGLAPEPIVASSQVLGEGDQAIEARSDQTLEHSGAQHQAPSIGRGGTCNLLSE